MKAAYHFTSKELGTSYGEPIYRKVFGEILSFRHTSITSTILTGDFLPSRQIQREDYPAFLTAMIYADGNAWRKFDIDRSAAFLTQNVFIICFESISKQAAELLDKGLKDFSSYMGAFEIDDTNPIHYHFYSASLPAYFRIMNKRFFLLTPDEEGIDESWKDFFESIGFEEVKHEITGLFRSVFDHNHSFESARLLAEWKKSSNELLATITDSIISRLIDAAPELGMKLWSTFGTFEKSETTEQLAQVMMSCRRIFEYVTDCVFPPTDKMVEGHSLKKDKYKNRLMQFASESKASATNIDLIVANTETLFQQWEKLLDLANKGIHDEVYKEETRRCIIRTVMLLDDIISLKNEPFQIQTKLNKEFDRMANAISKKHKPK